MEKTEAYECLHQNDPLPNLIESTNKYLLKLRLDNWITQKQYEQLSIKQNEVELAHLYYLPKAPKPGTPLRPIVSGLKHPTIKISRFLDKLLRPLFDRMALSTTVTSGTEVIKQLYEWSKSNARQDTLICTMDVIDLYTMIPQTEGILEIKKMLDYLNIKQINENKNGEFFTEVYHKPSYEPYYLPFNSVHPIHMKKNIPYAMLIRAIKYCSTFNVYIHEREKLRMALLLNKYPGEFIEKQFNRVFKNYNMNQSVSNTNYNVLREKMIHMNKKEEIIINYNRTMFVHFTYCLNMKTFPQKCHTLWNKYFIESPINEIKPILGTRNVKNLQQQLIRNK
ncbi:unnamed protein product [Rotaria magnacalcarata]|uniref:Helix-turn-helix domain-containing protein n=1 Tax=Rotaria magnacalcarata TaxID=392030 RepID=A0A816SJP8_9BILA|nr:unnamed protein product [Rotaria magnacalcarata]